MRMTSPVRLFAALAVAFGFALGGSAPAAAEPAEELIVRYRAGSAAQGTTSERQALGVASAGAAGVVRVAVPVGGEAAALAALSARPDVAWAAPNRRMRRMGVIDPLAEPLHAEQWHLEAIRAHSAWRFARGEPGVTVAVVDSGIDAAHPDRPTHLILGPSFAEAPLGDTDGHGTLIAGVIASPINGVGTLGVAPEVTVMALKVDDAEGAIRVFDVYRAIIWAVDNGAEIVNVSLGLSEDLPPLREAVEYARARNVLVIAAAGNSGAEGNPVIYPAAYPGVLAVGATTAEGRVAAYSETGAFVSLVAPGGDPESVAGGVLGTLPGGRYGRIAGTSVAAPLASGVAALVWSIDPALGAEGVRNRLLATARDAEAPGRDDQAGAGIVDAGRAARETAARFPHRALYQGQECPTVVAAGGRTSVSFWVSNAGGQSWSRGGVDPVSLIAARPDGRASPFHVPLLWVSPGRPVRLPVESVPVGGLVELTFPMQAPERNGTYREHFRLQSEGGVPFQDMVLFCDVRLVPETPWLAADGRASGPPRLAPGARGRVTVAVRNVGTATWRAGSPNRITLGTAAPIDRASAVYDPSTWLGPNRAAVMRELSVAPGELATFAFDVVAPASPGVHVERFAPVVEGVAWLSEEVQVIVEVAP